MAIDIEMEKPKSDPILTVGRTVWQKIQFYFNLLNHIMIFVVAIYMSFVCYGTGNRVMSWHTWLSTLGYQLLMTEAILAFYSENVWSQQHTRPVRKTLHWILQTVGSLIAIIGMIILYWVKKTHFTTTHDILGLVSGIFTLIGMFNGVSALFAIELNQYVKPIYSKFVHNFTGIAAFVIGMASLYYGYDRNYMQRNSRPDIRMWLQILAIITIVLTLVGALRSLFNQLRAVFRV